MSASSNTSTLTNFIEMTCSDIIRQFIHCVVQLARTCHRDGKSDTSERCAVGLHVCVFSAVSMSVVSLVCRQLPVASSRMHLINTLPLLDAVSFAYTCITWCCAWLVLQLFKWNSLICVADRRCSLTGACGFTLSMTCRRGIEESDRRLQRWLIYGPAPKRYKIVGINQW